MKNRRVIAASLLAGTCLLLAGIACAEPVNLVLWKNGVWRAKGSYDAATRMMCVKGFNNAPGARVYVFVETASGNLGTSAWGNNEQCTRLPVLPHTRSGMRANLSVHHFTESGANSEAGPKAIIL